ncbi:hypothetical protein [Pasteurella multocida]|uniref:hypothetical protein n=1 Tax=Pasteurella multocida TaxID=747 RepID=UPI000BBD1B09|nr:hypothetical protein [Pasteurella multocida]ATF73933.1 hypothetical protein CO688_00435 [Pasteurella multocida]ATN16335.1 hypothetical protein CRN72_00725 [Pasteurella multocida]AWB52368.1 hypothetical protein DB278_02135 [Pasteurella multocida]HDR0997864.1 hypothetical protein [Pasteurella multocida]HDR1016367.1 hypothetical protein [Pasteurella multocida]
MAITFTYNQEQALKAGQSNFITETGAYVVKILQAKYTRSTNGAEALEFSVETEDGLKGDYISIFYKSKNGDSLQNGVNLIQAIMGCTNTQQLSVSRSNDCDIAPELTGKKVGLFLQKELYTKNNGQDGYRLQIVCPFGAQTRKTLSEHLENKAPERIQWLVEHYKDKDSRNTQQQAVSAQNQLYSAPQQTNNFEEDNIPF